MHLTDHFIENWQIRVGNLPTRPMVREIIRQSVPVNPCIDLYDQSGRPYRVYAIYWHPDLDLIIKVDKVAWRAITVLSRDNYIQHNQHEKVNHAKKPKAGRQKKRPDFLLKRAQKRSMSMRKAQKGRQGPVF